jgi:hypothetical protein
MFRIRHGRVTSLASARLRMISEGQTVLGDNPMEISPGEWATRVFLFGPELLPDSDLRASPTPISHPPEPNEITVVAGSERNESPERPKEPAQNVCWR